MTGSFTLVISIYNGSNEKGSCDLDCHQKRPRDVWAFAATNDHGSNTDWACVARLAT